MINKVVICPSCTAEYAGNFCPHCGEKKLSHHDFTLKHFIEESFESFTHFDGKFFSSVKLLVSRPGLLTRYFTEGRRVGYMRPFQLFIVSNLIFFLLLGQSNVFAISFYNYLQFDPYQSFGTRETVHQKYGSRHLEAVAVLFNEKMASQSKAFLFFFIPVFAFFFALLFYKKRKYLSEHFFFSLHFFSFLLFYFIAFRFLAEIPFAYFSGVPYSQAFDSLSSVLNLTVFAVYIGASARVYYRVSYVHSVAAAIVTAILFIFFLYVYRMLLFYKIIYSLHT